MIAATTQDFQLSIPAMLTHAASVHPDASVREYSDGVLRRSLTMADLLDEAARLAAGLSDLGTGHGGSVGSLCWNTVTHLEPYGAVPASGRVLHLINARLSDEQLAFVINDAAAPSWSSTRTSYHASIDFEIA